MLYSFACIKLMLLCIMLTLLNSTTDYLLILTTVLHIRQCKMDYGLIWTTIQLTSPGPAGGPVSDHSPEVGHGQAAVTCPVVLAQE